ncbi:MAG: efflux RND transporter periplasmic adaptor subunit [Thiobacillus sp.]
MKTLRLKPIVWGLIVLLLIGAGAWLVSSRKDTAPQQAPKPALTVSTALPVQSQLPITLAANGNIVAWQEAIIGSESNGLRLTEVRVNVGDYVRAGQVLATFAAESIDADVAQSNASLSEALANAAEASANAKRARTLESTGALSTQQINQYLTAEQTAKARVAASRAMLAAQKLRLRHTRLVAPDSGIISARTATVGAVVPGGTELFRLIRQGRLEWRAEVTATELSRIRPGNVARINLSNGNVISGRVRMVGPTVDPQTRAALVYVDLPRSEGKNPAAKAGMFAQGEFDLGMSPALTVPQQAVVIRDGFTYVFRFNTDSRVSQIKVRTGRRLSDQVEVIEGITPDTVLVVNGAGFLNDGDLVKNVSQMRRQSSSRYDKQFCFMPARASA